MESRNFIHWIAGQVRNDGTCDRNYGLYQQSYLNALIDAPIKQA